MVKECFGVSLCVILEFGWLRNVWGFSVCHFGIWMVEECFGVSLCVILEFGGLRNVSGFLCV